MNGDGQTWILLVALGVWVLAIPLLILWGWTMRPPRAIQRDTWLDDETPPPTKVRAR